MEAVAETAPGSKPIIRYRVTVIFDAGRLVLWLSESAAKQLGEFLSHRFRPLDPPRPRRPKSSVLSKPFPQKDVLQCQFSNPLRIRLSRDDFVGNALGKRRFDFFRPRRVVGGPSIAAERGQGQSVSLLVKGEVPGIKSRRLSFGRAHTVPDYGLAALLHRQT
jgi:hypothetical protein